MHKLCKHVYIAGPKKHQVCDRFIRKSPTDYCWQHNPQHAEKELSEKELEVMGVSPEKESQPIIVLEKEPPKKEPEPVVIAPKKKETQKKVSTPKVAVLKNETPKEPAPKVTVLKVDWSSDSSDFSISSDY
jgi:hypothetical protein